MSIRISGLTKTYGLQKALDNISFEVRPGEILGFLGPNGAGKSTTMKIITGLVEPNSGLVEVAGKDIRSFPVEARKIIGYLAEQNPLYTEMYVAEFLRFAGALNGMKGKHLDERVNEMISITGLKPEQHKKIGALSKGYRQRVGLAQALIHDPQVLILDEPTSGLDPNQIIEIRQLIKKFGKEKTLIFSSHILPEVQALADRVVIINKGKIIADKPVSELKSLGGNNVEVVRVEFEKDQFNLQPLMELIPGIKTEKLGSGIFRLSGPADSDIRKVVYAESVKQGNPILAMQKEESSLEDVFHRLTETEEKIVK